MYDRAILCIRDNVCAYMPVASVRISKSFFLQRGLTDEAIVLRHVQKARETLACQINAKR